MSNFAEALALNNLGATIEEQYGEWGHFTEDAAALIVLVSRLEAIAPELLAVTWMNESTFGFHPLPNVNHDPGCPFMFDVGPFQLNVGWTYRSVWVGEFSAKGIHYKEAFGTVFLQDAPFDGNPQANARMAARKLLAIKGPDVARVVKYTGPGERQEHRLGDWRKYSPLFQEFFAAYKVGV